METFLKANPGLRSRFDRTLIFEDYQEEELMAIASSIMSEKGLRLTSASQAYLSDWLRQLLQSKDRYFGNARTVRQVIDELQRLHRTVLARQSATSPQPLDTPVALETIKEVKQVLESSTWIKTGIGFRKM